MDEIGKVREKIDIVSLINEYIPLKKMGRNFKTLCPFHSEKTPSFVVSPERQIWHCFGCQKGGDSFSFLMEYEKMDFVEALKTLAKKAGIPLLSSSFQTGVSSKKEKIYTLNKLASDFYHYVLTKHKAGQKAMFYLLQTRKINASLIETFNLGFSPKVGNALSSYLINKKKYKKEDLVEAGLSFYRNSRAWDFFRGRIMFPLFDHRGNIVGFSGRAMDDSADGGKYINTRDTLVYHKGDMFFGLNMAKEKIKKTDSAIIVEGEFDVISMFSEGFENVLAVKGTALTENQTTLLSRFAKNVVLCFDKDDAGFSATKRSLPVLEKQGLTVKAIELTDAKDVDEMIKKDPFKFKKSVKNEIPIYDYIFSKLASSFDKNTIDGKREIGKEFLSILINIENEIVKEHYLKKLSLELDSSYESIVREMEKIEKKEKIGEDMSVKREARKDRREVLEEYLLALLIQEQNPKSVFNQIRSALQDYQFRIEACKKIMDLLDFYFKEQNRFDIQKFVKVLASELTAVFDTCYLLPLPKFPNLKDYEKELEKVATELRTLFLKEKIKTMGQNLKTKEEEKELSQLIHLLKESSSVIK